MARMQCGEWKPAGGCSARALVPVAPSDSASGILDAALAAPIGTPPLRDLARGRRSAAILIPGKARCVGTREYVPRLLHELNAPGIAGGAGQRAPLRCVLGVLCALR